MIKMSAQIPEKAYAKFDFIPGEKVLFEDNFLNEIPDEIPSYWEVSGGRVETSIINGEKVMGFLDENGNANLRLKKNTVIGNRTTIEFEYLWPIKLAFFLAKGYLSILLVQMTDIILEKNLEIYIILFTSLTKERLSLVIFLENITQGN
jgi:hypothetical protein